MTMTNAVVLIEAERDAMSTLGGALADIEGVAEAYSVTGEWDFVAIVRVPDHEQLADVVTVGVGDILRLCPGGAFLDRQIPPRPDDGRADEAGVRADARPAAVAALAGRL